MVQTAEAQLQVSQRNSLPPPTRGSVAGGVKQGPALPHPPGQVHVAEEVKRVETARSDVPQVRLRGSGDPEASLEVWSECTVKRSA